MGIRKRKPAARIKSIVSRKSPKSWIRRKIGLLLMIGAGAAAATYLLNPSKRNQVKQKVEKKVEKVKESFGTNGQTEEQAPLTHTGGAAS